MRNRPIKHINTCKGHFSGQTQVKLGQTEQLTFACNFTNICSRDKDMVDPSFFKLHDHLFRKKHCRLSTGMSQLQNLMNMPVQHV